MSFLPHDRLTRLLPFVPAPGGAYIKPPPALRKDSAITHLIHVQPQPNGDWVFLVQDGLGSVRGVADESLNMLESRLYAPYGVPFGVQGTPQTVYGFTGEPTDANELVYLRARYLNPGLGVFVSLDLVEGQIIRAMSLNGYSWVEGNVANETDPSGNILENISRWNNCSGSNLPFDEGCTIPAVRELGLGQNLGLIGLTPQDMTMLALNIPVEARIRGDIFTGKMTTDDKILKLQTITWLSRTYVNRYYMGMPSTVNNVIYSGSLDYNTRFASSWNEAFGNWLASKGEPKREPTWHEFSYPPSDFVRDFWTKYRPVDIPFEEYRRACRIAQEAVLEWDTNRKYWPLFYFGHWDREDLKEHDYIQWDPITGQEIDYLRFIDTVTCDRIRHVCCDMLYQRYNKVGSLDGVLLVGYRGAVDTIFAASLALPEVIEDHEGRPVSYHSACDHPNPTTNYLGHRWYWSRSGKISGKEVDVCREECRDGNGYWWYPNPECPPLQEK